MDYEEKIEYFCNDMKRRGIGGRIAMPPLIMLMRRMGFNAMPLIFWRPISILAVFGALFALLYGLLSWLLLWRYDNLPSVWMNTVSAVVVGVMVGVYMAVAWWKRARNLCLPSWDKYPLGDCSR